MRASNCEPLEPRRYFALSLVHQELHRPPICLAGDGLDDVVAVTLKNGGGSKGHVTVLK